MLKLRSTETNVEVHVEGGRSFSLPTPADLKSMAIDEAKRFHSDGRSQVADLLEECEFQYEIARSENGHEEVVGLVAITSDDTATVLRDLHNPLAVDAWTALMDVCPDLGSERVVVRKELGKPIPNGGPSTKSRKRGKGESDDSSMPPFIPNLIEFLVTQGRVMDAFEEAASWGHLPSVQKFIDEGQPVNGISNSGCTPLIVAAAAGQKAIVELLIAAGADVNAVDNKRGMSPLLWAMASGITNSQSIAVVGALMKAGANPGISSNDGMSALQLAQGRKSEKLIAMITHGP